MFYAFYVGVGVSIRIHWFSQFVAGAVIGSLIGAVFGKSFEHRSASVEPLDMAFSILHNFAG
jgi:hypothetical protein